MIHTLFYFIFLQMGSATPATGSGAHDTATHQPNPQTGSNNQVRVGDACHRQEQPPPPRRSSSLLPALRRRASEPLPHSHRQRYTQRPGETHTRYTYGFNQRERHSGYTFGFTQRDADVEYSHDEGGYTQSDVYRSDRRYEFGPVAHSQTLSSLNRPTEGNLNRERYEYGYTHGHAHSRTPADTQGRVPLDNTHGHALVDTQGNTHSRKLTHARTHSSRSNAYTENIRAMAGQMYGDPPTQSRIPTNRITHGYVDTHSHNYAHNHALTRHHHLHFSGGL